MSAGLAEDDTLRQSVAGLMSPHDVPDKPRQFRAPIVTGRVLLDLRVPEMDNWDATDEAHRRVRAFWCRPGADLMLMVGAGLSPLPFLLDPILEHEPRTVDVIDAEDGTVGKWVRALRGTAVDGVSTTDPIGKGLHTLQTPVVGGLHG